MSAPKVEFGRSSRKVVAYVEMRGAYRGIGDAMAALKEWLDSEGIEQTGHPFCLFYDNPGETPEDELRSEACIPIEVAFEPRGRFKSKVLEETPVAETRHHGPPEEFGRTYGPSLEGLLNTGHRIDGPAREYFMSVADVRGPGSGYLIQQPISR